MADRSYTPTVGMILALAGHRNATQADVDRCRLRGLMGLRGPTTDGRAILSRYQIVGANRG